MKLKRIMGILMIFILVFSLAGCATKSAEQNKATAEQNKPAAEQKVYKLTMATMWPASVIHHQAAEAFAKKVNIITNGRLQVTVHPSGAVIGPYDLLDGVSSGTIDCAWSCANMWAGKHQATYFFASVPMLFEPVMHFTWLYEGGGLELWNKLYQDVMKLNVVVFPAGGSHSELLAWSHKPLAKIEDFKGLKYRTIGWWGDILKARGTAVTNVPGAEVFQSLERGVVDAAEYNTPLTDMQLGFYEITKYYVGPGMHQPATMNEFLINKDKWEALPEDLKEVISDITRSVGMEFFFREINGSIKALEKYDQSGNKRVYVDKETQKEFRKIAWDYIDQLAEKQDDYFKEVWKSAKSFYLNYVEFEKFMTPIRPE